MLKIFGFKKKPLHLFVYSIAITLVIVACIATYDVYKEKELQRRVAHARINPVKVFQIGFSKCGTVTIASFFSSNSIRAIHHDFGKLASSMYHNYLNGKPLLLPKYQHYDVYTDMENMFVYPPISVGMMMFKELDKQYPGSKFILNVRDKNAWLKSRSLHPLSPVNKKTILELNAELLKKSEKDVLAQWSKEWDAHIKAVTEYFKDRPNDLLVFDIEQDPPEKITVFLKDNFVLDPKLYAHKNKSSERDMLRAKRLSEKEERESNTLIARLNTKRRYLIHVVKRLYYKYY